MQLFTATIHLHDGTERRVPGIVAAQVDEAIERALEIEGMRMPQAIAIDIVPEGVSYPRLATPTALAAATTCKLAQAADKLAGRPTAATMYALEWSGDVQYFGDETALPNGRFVHLCETQADGVIHLLGTRAAMEAEANEAAETYAERENRFRNWYRPVPIPFAGEVPDTARAAK
ncbi:MAG: hypothetical protein ACOY3N_23145 [Bradyrhizobium sp.]|uniref:hypothetical protein n=1 Tax=Bradyrhizobium sp. TaxID=376 RepID=UPI003BF28FE7